MTDQPELHVLECHQLRAALDDWKTTWPQKEP